MGKQNTIKDWSNEKLYSELRSSRNVKFNPGIIYLVQQEINRRWVKSWSAKPKKEKTTIKWESTDV